MVMDFADLKHLVKLEIVNRFDHSLMVNKLVPQKQIDLLRKTSERIILVEFQPTTENIATHIAGILQRHLPAAVELFSIRLYETVTSFAEWFASDNAE
jgi:6-pyruvoyltetrahydropterin/6-carboxytetrahydropterin synthase